MSSMIIFCIYMQLHHVAVITVHTHVSLSSTSNAVEILISHRY